MSARSRKDDWVEQALIDWAAWIHIYFDAQGCGGIDPGEGPRIRGSGAYSNPVLSEVIATDIDGQSQNQRVHRHLRRYAKEFNREWFRVAWVRYVGVPKPTTTKTIAGEGMVEVSSGCGYVVKMNREAMRTYIWSGMKEIATVADITGIKQRAVEVMLSNLKVELGLDLRMDMRVLKGLVISDGMPSAAEIVSIREAKVKRNQKREDQDCANSDMSTRKRG